MKQLRQFLIYDNGTTDLECQISIANNPLKRVKRQPDLIVSWSTDRVDFWCAYWVKQGHKGMNADELKRFCSNGFLLVR